MQHTVLIIDDNDNDILITKRVLARTGLDIRTEVALSGEAGLALLRGLGISPSLILLDLKMPGMSGIEVLRRIRADKNFCCIPVIVVTHSSLESDREVALSAGADSYLCKAFDMDKFRSELGSLLKIWLGSRHDAGGATVG